MCGIFGHIVYNPARDPASWQMAGQMAGTLAHRGPDGYSLHQDTAPGMSIAFGAGRLAIIDLAAPPGVVFNEDRTIAIAFNGEIYNHRALRAELEAAGHVYRTHTDTETIVHGYEQWGDGVLEHLRGMFGLALWDSNRGRLLLARDRAGEKPLYYADLGGELVFASEAKALFCHPRLQRAVNHEALPAYLVLGYTTPPDTLFAGVKRLAPGECMGVDVNGRGEPRPYSVVRIAPSADLPYPEAVKRLRAQLEATVGAQMMSDVPVGAFLSGGVDSTAVVAFMRQHTAHPVNTFTVGFDEPPGSPEDAKFNVDARYAREVAAAFGTQHHEIRIRADEQLADLLPRLVYQQDDPISLPTVIQTVYVSALARANGVPVLLNGEAGDELFMGYPYFAADRWVSRYARLPGLLRKGVLDPLIEQLPGARFASARALAHKARLNPAARYADWVNMVSVHDAGRMSARPLDMGGVESWLTPLLNTPDSPHFADRVAFASLRGFVGEFNNMRVDKMCMAMSIEARSPLEDRALVELALNLPMGYKLRAGDFKRILKDAVRDLVPESVLNRPKWGFNPPASNWLRGCLRPLVDQYLSRERVEAAGVFNPEAIARLRDDHMSRRGYALQPIWSALVFHLWHSLYIEQDLALPGALTPDGVTSSGSVVRSNG